MRPNQAAPILKHGLIVLFVFDKVSTKGGLTKKSH